MSIDNYTIEQQRQLVIEITNIFNENNKKYIKRLKSNKKLNDFIMWKTSFLKTEARYCERVYCVIHNITQIPECPTCGNPVKFDKPSHCGYKKHCSTRCSTLDENVKKKLQVTSMNKYGCKSPSQSDAIKEKIVKTCIERYGVINGGGSEQALKKIRQTNLLRYGVEYTWQTDDVKKKIKNTCIKRYGVDHYNRSQESKDKHLKTNKSKYGVDAPSQLDEVKNKIKMTNIKRYGGVAPASSKNVRQKMKKTTMDRYGVEHYTQSYEYHKRKRHKYHSEKISRIDF